MKELVERLSNKTSAVQANRPDKSAALLKQRIDLNYVHILFKETGTEIGVKLDRKNCTFSKADFENGTGLVHLEGVLNLNYKKVRCVADISLSTMEGEGILKAVDEKEYQSILSMS